MEKLIEVFGILGAKGDDSKIKYLCLNSVPPHFLSWVVDGDETLRDGVDMMFSEYGLDTHDIPKRPVRMIDVPRRNLTYIFLLECELPDLLEYLGTREDEDLILVEKENLTGEARSWVEELERKIEG